MKRFRIFNILSFTAILFITISCFNDSPKSALLEYLDAKYSSNYEQAYSKLSSEDKSIKSLEEFTSENNQKALLSIINALSNTITYEVISVTVENNTAFAVIETDIPDSEKMIGELMGSFFSKMFDKDFDENEMMHLVEEKFKDKEIPMTKKTDTINLVKEKVGWFVFLDWKTKKIEQEKREKVKYLLSEAEELLEEKKLYGAIAKYEQILELDSKIVEAKEGIEETNLEIQVLEEKQNYIDNIELYDLKASYHKTYIDGNMPGVTFKLRNKGAKTLNEVEVTVYFKDENGSVIYEENYYPVLVSKYSFNDKKPLKPNYVWSMGKGKFYKVENVPSEWKTGAVSAKITNIEFK